MNNPTDIYKAYLTNHFYIKQELLRNIIGDFDRYSSLWSDTSGYFEKHLTEKEILLSLKLEMATTMYQSIEALFSLMHSLERNGRANDDNLWHHLSIPNHKIVDWIDDIASGEKKITGEIIYKGNKVDRLKYFFYFDNLEVEKKELVEESIPVIEEGLLLLASEFKSRALFNAYKHGLRLFNSLSAASIFVNDDMILELDGSSSVTFLENIQVKGKNYDIVHRNLDYEMCYNLTIFTTSLISNLIKSRRIKLSNKVEQFFFYEPSFLDHIREQTIKWDHFRIRIEAKSSK